MRKGIKKENWEKEIREIFHMGFLLPTEMVNKAIAEANEEIKTGCGKAIEEAKYNKAHRILMGEMERRWR